MSGSLVSSLAKAQIRFAISEGVNWKKPAWIKQSAVRGRAS